jgi:hypothetical protein
VGSGVSVGTGVAVGGTVLVADGMAVKVGRKVMAGAGVSSGALATKSGRPQLMLRIARNISASNHFFCFIVRHPSHRLGSFTRSEVPTKA